MEVYQKRRDGSIIKVHYDDYYIEHEKRIKKDLKELEEKYKNAR